MNRGSIVITKLVGYEADFRMSERTLRSGESQSARKQDITDPAVVGQGKCRALVTSLT